MFDLKISDIHEAKSLGDCWATQTVSLLNTDGLENISFNLGHLVVRFDDLDSEKEQCHRPGMQHAPKMKDVKQILEFTKTFTDDDTVLIHCHAGICRSTAVALLVLIQHGMPIDEAIEKVLEIRPIAWPNKLIVRLGDVALEKDGALIGFMNKWWKDNLIPKRGW